MMEMMMMVAIVIQEEKNPESSTLDFFGRLGRVEEDRGVRVVCKVILSFCHFVILSFCMLNIFLNVLYVEY